MSILAEISAALQKGDMKTVQQGVEKALADGMEPKAILYDGLMDGMNIIGGKFTRNEVFVPEVLIAARAMNEGMKILKPKLIETGVESVGLAVIGTVKGDLHDIGKNLVRMMLEGAGFDVEDLGTDIPPEKFVAAVQEMKPQVLGMSALLTTTMGEMKKVIDALVEAGVRDQVKVMVGGAPVTDDYAKQIGADYYGKDAAEAAVIAKKVVA